MPFIWGMNQKVFVCLSTAGHSCCWQRLDLLICVSSPVVETEWRSLSGCWLSVELLVDCLALWCCCELLTRAAALSQTDGSYPHGSLRRSYVHFEYQTMTERQRRARPAMQTRKLSEVGLLWWKWLETICSKVKYVSGWPLFIFRHTALQVEG